MTAANLMSLVPEPSPTSVRATIDALLNTRRAIERAVADLGTRRWGIIAAAIDAFSAASKNGVSGADAVKAKGELDAIKAAFDCEEQALHSWEHAVNDRLRRLAVDSWAEVQEALEIQIAALELQKSTEEIRVGEVNSVILEFDQLRTELQPKGNPPAPAGTKKTKGDTSTNAV